MRLWYRANGLLAGDVAAEDVRLHPVHEDEDTVASWRQELAWYSMNTAFHELNLLLKHMLR